jgi:hypothetical protein
MVQAATQAVRDQQAAPVGRVDFSVHGILGIRMVNAMPADAATISGQLGACQVQACEEPDIVLEFVERLPTSGIRYVGSGDAGFCSDGLLVLQRGSKRVRIDLSGIGKQCRIVCESGIGTVPLLESIADVAVLEKGYASLHASSFIHREKGILATGWAHSGKTTALLAFAQHGAKYVSDDRVWLHAENATIYGCPQVLTLKDWQLDELARLSRRVSTTRRAALLSLRWIESTAGGQAAARNGQSLSSKLLHKSVEGIRRRLYPRVGSVQLFDAPGTTQVSRLNTLFVMMRHNSPAIHIEQSDPAASRMRAWSSARQDQAELFEHYRAFRFAYPDRRNEFLERAARLHYELLSKALRGTEAYIVFHPSPVSLSELYRKMEPFSC